MKNQSKHIDTYLSLSESLRFKLWAVIGKDINKKNQINTYLKDKGFTVLNVGAELSDLYEEIDCLKLYPNPTSDYFKIESDFNSFLVSICSMDGRIQKELSLQNNYEEIDITQLPNGLYFIKIYNLKNDDFCIQKIIKI